MALAASTLICAYLLIELLLPALRTAQTKDQAKRQEQLYFTKLRLIRKYYSELQEHTYSEIAEQYDVEALWNNIGTHPRRTSHFVATLRT
jgi:hypothetical protein